MEPGIDIEEHNKSKIGYELAQFLKFPLIDGDIIPTLQDLVEPEQCDGFLPSEILSRNSSTQFSLKLSVIINSQLPRRALFDGLAERASSTGAQLVAIESSNQNDHNVDCSDTGNVPKLNIDTPTPFNAEDFITGTLEDAEVI
ncbi:hypothetical protein NC651_009364 [Populus alba x Populus x berolinensis]|nr:hypothetical protein NC651_009364 [Populus alba x Populus x berolinensis]